MILTKATVARKLLDYLQGRITLSELIIWADEVATTAVMEPEEAEVIRPILARLGIADVSRFGLTWEDCQAILQQLGYRVRMEMHPDTVAGQNSPMSP
ncbi:MAG: hypothetical protein D6775_16820 [Caldilineae bacterium]|nr:MAG: hypothetical protein D6775_16820 [Caldilineae bacterium]